MNDCSIRTARLTDATAIARLVTQLGYPTSSGEMENRLRLLLTHSDYITFVAEISNTVVGMVGAHVGHALEFSGTYGRLTGIVVDEQWRGRGIGQMLMGQIELWLRETGATLVVLTSGSQRVEAHRFYKALGYDETGVRFVKRLA